MSEDKLKVLLELRPALEGFAGIPQETRLLFRGLCDIDNVELEGLLIPPFRRLARGTTEGLLQRRLSQARKINRYSRVVVSLSEAPFSSLLDALFDYIVRRSETARLTLSNLLGLSRMKLSNFETRYFEDFVWRTLFSKTLAASDFKLVTSKNHKICSVGWDSQQTAGLFTLTFSRYPTFPRLDTREFDIFLAQTPYPARVSRNTTMVVRYHDAIPIFMPHTINSKKKHQAHHFYSLMGNVRSGAHFACVSEASRQALLSVFPEAERRSVTIHNMVSHHYFREESLAERVPQIIRTRLDRQSESTVPKFLTLRETELFYRRVLGERPFRYVLAVSTVEPRKNHARLLAAWEHIQAEVDPELKLVVVGGLGWEFETIMRGFRSAIDQGRAFFTNSVPAADLRVLYRHALATVCPSLGEGFDYSGVEAMCSGGVVVASDINTHREVYDDAAEYFDPYSTASAVTALKRVLYGADAARRREELMAAGARVSGRYLPAVLLPKWRDFLDRVARERKV